MKNEVCPLCGHNLGPKPVGGGVGVATDFFLVCDNAHERIIYSALTSDWSTKSDEIANQLSAQGYALRREGNSYVFGDAPERELLDTQTKKPWWIFW